MAFDKIQVSGSPTVHLVKFSISFVHEVSPCKNGTWMLTNADACIYSAIDKAIQNVRFDFLRMKVLSSHLTVLSVFVNVGWVILFSTDLSVCGPLVITRDQTGITSSKISDSGF